MKPTMRTYQTEEDYWCIREFLREASLVNNRHDFAWSLLRWDYWRWHLNENIFHFTLQDVITLWEANGYILAMLNPDGDGEAFFQIHPAFHEQALVAPSGSTIVRERRSSSLSARTQIIRNAGWAKP